jgi:hypothetical protein
MTDPEEYLAVIFDFIIPKLDFAQKDSTLPARLKAPLLDAEVALRKVQLLIQQKQ